MANEEQLAILKQGVEEWNLWRQEHVAIQPDLIGADLKGTNLRKADLSGANLSGALLMGTKLYGANLSGANFSRASIHITDIRDANLSEANLSDADLTSADFGGANLSEANLSRTILTGTHFNYADLTRANLRKAYIGAAYLKNATLCHADLTEADLSVADLTAADLTCANLVASHLSGTVLNRADFSSTTIEYTRFDDVDLSVVKGLETVQHNGPSTIGIDTIYRSGGNIPEIFLKGAGVDDTFITYIRSLVGKPIKHYSCFISYSSRDQTFAERLYADLQAKGVRCWFAPEDLKIGDKFWHRIDESIRLYDKLLVVLSEHSVQSDWVEREVMAALEKEKQGKIVLFPITLDDAVKDCTAPWAADLRRQRHIGDFRRWKNHDNYQKAFDRLLRDLKTEAKQAEER